VSPKDTKEKIEKKKKGKDSTGTIELSDLDKKKTKEGKSESSEIVSLDIKKSLQKVEDDEVSIPLGEDEISIPDSDDL